MTETEKKAYQAGVNSERQRIGAELYEWHAAGWPSVVRGRITALIEDEL